MKKSTTKSKKSQQRMRPATTPEARENQMIALAVDLAEQQLRDGTATSQVITHFLKLGTMRAQAEMESIRMQNKLAEAKIESLQSAKRVEELYANALEAMKHYSGRDDEEEYDDEEY